MSGTIYGSLRKDDVKTDNTLYNSKTPRGGVDFSQRANRMDPNEISQGKSNIHYRRGDADKAVQKAIKSLQRAKGVNGQEVYAKCRSDCRITGNGCQVPLHNFGKLRFLYNDDPGAYRTGEQSLPDSLSFTVGVNHSQGAENKQQNFD